MICPIENRYYYTLNDILTIMGNRYTPDATWLQIINTNVNRFWSSDRSVYSQDDFITALGCYLFDTKKALIVSNELYTSMNIDIAIRLNQIISKINSILPDFVNLYNVLGTELTSLKTRSTTKFNDTPTEEGNFSTDVYTSTITTNENETDYSIYDQINLIKQKQQHLIAKFCKEFEGFIVWIN